METAQATEPASAPTEIVDVLGRSRPIDRIYEDGAWNCPFCWSAVSPERPCEGNAPGYGVVCAIQIHCQNPACFANPHYPRERAREELEKAERAAAEEKRRKADHEWAMRRSAEDAKARAEHLQGIRQEANERGACVTCAIYSARFGHLKAKFTKHRTTCPRASRR